MPVLPAKDARELYEQSAVKLDEKLSIIDKEILAACAAGKNTVDTSVERIDRERSYNEPKASAAANRVISALQAAGYRAHWMQLTPYEVHHPSLGVSDPDERIPETANFGIRIIW